MRQTFEAINGLLVSLRQVDLEQNALDKDSVKRSVNGISHTNLVCSNVIRFPMENDGFFIILLM